MHWNLTMTDSYLDFANSPVGARLADALGLPKPLKLERYKPGQPVIKGSVLLGGAGDPQMLGVLAPMFKAMGAQTVAHAQLPQWMPLANKAGLMTGPLGCRWQARREGQGAGVRCNRDERQHPIRRALHLLP
jgi:3-oxoacyl-[acyl-carrier protein] reductase